MFSEKQLKQVPEEIEKILKQLERDIFDDVIERLKEAKKITRTIDWQMYVLKQIQRYPNDLKKRIQRALGLSNEQIDKLYKEVIADGYANDKALYEATGVEFTPLEESYPLKQLIGAIQEQTKKDFNNITATTGIITNERIAKTMPTYFKDELNKASLEIMSGAFNYDETLKRITNEMANSGLRQIDYASGHHDRVDVATRRAVMTGMKQVTQKISEDNAKALKTNYYEVSAHITARPSHALWQGKVYSYEQLVSVCGLGTGAGLNGWNCYHTYDPFVVGVSVRRYSDKDLKRLYDETQKKHSFNGKEYTPYEATQRQRAMERIMRAQDEKLRMLKKGEASKEAIQEVQNRRNLQYQEYKAFSKQMGLPEQMARVFNSEVKSVFKIENNVNDDSSEVKVGRLLYASYGGHFTVRERVNDENVKTPDFKWNSFDWELKDVSSINATDKAMRKAMKQIANAPGGIVFNIVDDKTRESIGILKETIKSRAKRGNLDSFEVILVDNGNAIIDRYKI